MDSKEAFEVFNDLSEFISQVDELGECKIIEGADWDLEISLITELQLSRPNQPMLLFDKIKGYEPGYRVLTNSLNTEKRFALAHGLPLEAKGIELVKAWRSKINQEFRPIPPVEVETGPVEENIYFGDNIDLLKFPTPKWRHFDGGRYIGTGDMIIQKHPTEGWTNLGTYRVQIYDKNTTGLHIIAGKHGDVIRREYWDRGQSCPAAVVCGADPLLWSVAGSSLCPLGVSEYDYVGWLRGSPVEVIKGKTVDLLIPARAEIVLEGEMMQPGTEERDEGPFGEWQGYYGGGIRSEPVFKVKCVLHRNNPVILGQLPMIGQYDFDEGGRHILRAANIWNELDRQLPGVKGVWAPPEARNNFMTVVSLKQMYGGHTKQAAMAVAGSYAGAYAGRYIVIVDDDIDPSNISEVLWAIATRCEPQEDIDIVGGLWGSHSDPRVPPERKKRHDVVHSLATIYACKPYSWISEFPVSIKSSPEVLEKVRQKWSDLLFG